MNRIFIMLSLVVVVASCKKQEKPAVVGTNEQGEELVVNETGDTVVYVAPVSDNSEVEKQDNSEVAAIKPEKDGTYKFELNLKKGQEYPFKIKTTATNSQSDGKQSQTITQESSTAVAYEVKEIRDSVFILDVTYKQFAESMTDGKEKLGFDTNSAEPTNEEAKQRWKFNKAVVGNTFQMEVSKSGKVQNITNLYKVRQNVKNAMKAGLSEDELKGLDSFLAAALSDEAMQQQFEESMAYYPKKKVKPGDTWSRNESEGNASSNVNYTFEGIKDGVATIKISGTSSGNDSKTDPNGSGMKLFQSLEGKVNGDVKIDVKSGWVKNAEMKKNETIRMTQEFQGQKMNFSSETKSTTTIN